MPPSATLIKICGITSVADALECDRLRVDSIGLNFYPKSPRYVDPDVAAQIVRSVSPRVRVIGVFVNAELPAVLHVARSIPLHAVQLHGDESPAYARQLAGICYIKAFRLADVAGWNSVLAYLNESKLAGHYPEAVLVDAYVPNEPGGTGTLIADEIMVRRPELPNLILAGGLNPGNVAARVRLTRPWMVDVASGVESSPGRKDPKLLAHFVENVRSASGTPNAAGPR